MFKSLYFGDLCGNVTMPCVSACRTCCSSACLIVLTFVITRNISRDVALLGARVEHLAADAAGVRGGDPVQADVVQPAVRGVGQGGMEAELAAWTPEPIGEGLHRLARGLLAWGRGRRGPSLASTRRRVAVISARLPRPHAGPDFVAVVEAGGALGGAGLAVEAGVVGVALPGDGASVHTILPRTVGITCMQRLLSFIVLWPKKQVKRVIRIISQSDIY